MKPSNAASCSQPPILNDTCSPGVVTVKLPLPMIRASTWAEVRAWSSRTRRHASSA